MGLYKPAFFFYSLALFLGSASNLCAGEDTSAFKDALMHRQWNDAEISVMEGKFSPDIQMYDLSSNYYGTTALCYAASEGQHVLVQKMLSKAQELGLPININAMSASKKNKGESTLWYMTNMANMPHVLVDYLLDNFKDINVNARPLHEDLSPEEDKAGPLWNLMNNPNMNIRSPLIELVKKINQRPEADFNAGPVQGDQQGETPLWKIVALGNLDLVKEVIAQKRALNYNAGPMSKNDSTVLLKSLERGWGLVALDLLNPEKNVYQEPIKDWVNVAFTATQKNYIDLLTILPHFIPEQELASESTRLFKDILKSFVDGKHYDLAFSYLPKEPLFQSNPTPIELRNYNETQKKMLILFHLYLNAENIGDEKAAKLAYKNAGLHDIFIDLSNVFLHALEENIHHSRTCRSSDYCTNHIYEYITNKHPDLKLLGKQNIAKLMEAFKLFKYKRLIADYANQIAAPILAKKNHCEGISDSYFLKRCDEDNSKKEILEDLTALIEKDNRLLYMNEGNIERIISEIEAIESIALLDRKALENIFNNVLHFLR